MSIPQASAIKAALPSPAPAARKHGTKRMSAAAQDYPALKNVLAHQIDSQSYEKSLLGQTNFDQTLTADLRAQAKLAVKDEYTFQEINRACSRKSPLSTATKTRLYQTACCAQRRQVI